MPLLFKWFCFLKPLNPHIGCRAEACRRWFQTGPVREEGTLLMRVAPKLPSASGLAQAGPLLGEPSGRARTLGVLTPERHPGAWKPSKRHPSSRLLFETPRPETSVTLRLSCSEGGERPLSGFVCRSPARSPPPNTHARTHTHPRMQMITAEPSLVKLDRK